MLTMIVLLVICTLSEVAGGTPPKEDIITAIRKIEKRIAKVEGEFDAERRELTAVENDIRGYKKAVDVVKVNVKKVDSKTDALKKSFTEFVKKFTERVTFLLVGGWDGSSMTYSVEKVVVTKYLSGSFDVVTSMMEEVPRPGSPTSVMQYTYLVRIGDTRLIFLKVDNDGYVYNVDTLRWSKTKRTDTPRAFIIPALNWNNGFLTFQSAAIKLFTKDFSSTKVGTFPEGYKPKVDHKVVKVSTTSFIVVGGRDYDEMSGAIMGTYLTSDIISWTTLQPTSITRFQHCLFILNKKVVVVGGASLTGPHPTSVEYLDLASSTPLKNQTWTSGPDLPKSLSGHSCHVAKGGTFAVIAGGFYGGQFTNKIFFMNEDLKLHELPQRLQTPRYRAASVLLEDGE